MIGVKNEFGVGDSVVSVVFVLAVVDFVYNGL